MGSSAAISLTARPPSPSRASTSRRRGSPSASSGCAGMRPPLGSPHRNRAVTEGPEASSGQVDRGLPRRLCPGRVAGSDRSVLDLGRALPLQRIKAVPHGLELLRWVTDPVDELPYDEERLAGPEGPGRVPRE